MANGNTQSTAASMTNNILIMLFTAFAFITGLIGQGYYVYSSLDTKIRNNTEKINTEVSEVNARITQLDKKLVKIQSDVSYIQGDLSDYKSIKGRVNDLSKLVSENFQKTIKAERNINSIQDQLSQLEETTSSDAQ